VRSLILPSNCSGARQVQERQKNLFVGQLNTRGRAESSDIRRNDDRLQVFAVFIGKKTPTL
jgi:hypothetical protein